MCHHTPHSFNLPWYGAGTVERPSLILLGMAVLLAAGLGLSIYAGVVVFEDIEVVESSVSAGSPLEVTATIPPGVGIFALDVREHTPGVVLDVRVLGPLGRTMTAVQVDTAQSEDTFEVEEASEYTLIIQYDGAGTLDVLAALGPEPDVSKTSLGFASLYMLLVGVVGMIVATIYLIWWRRRH